MRPARRWPLHPRPGPLESLSSWLGRIASLYNMSVKELLTHNLGQLDLQVPEIIDWDPPEAILIALTERTGIGYDHLRRLTLVGWEPWLFDTFHPRPEDAQEVFDTYVRQNSVLLAPGEAGSNNMNRWNRWYGPWRSWWSHRACPVCAADPHRGSTLPWQLPLMVGCVEHGCRLEDTEPIAFAVSQGRDGRKPTPVEEPLATLDRHTHEALTTGEVVLPGRAVHLGVWFRLLRSLLDEVSLSPGAVRAHGRATLERVWQAAGIPERGGLNVWRPYEELDWETQQTMLLAAATALRLAAEGEITAQGRLASAIQPPRGQHIYEGDRPDPFRSAWQEAVAVAEARMAVARTDRDAARQMLAWLTLSCSTLAEFEEQRAYLFGAGIPAAFLPSASELGRANLT